MYRIREKNKNDQWLIPFTDEPRLHPEDIQPEWVFIPFQKTIPEMIELGRYTFGQYIRALDASQLVALYNTNTLDLTFRSMGYEPEYLPMFLTIDPMNRIGTIRAISSEGLYVYLCRPINQLVPTISSIDQLKVSMYYLCMEGHSGLGKIIKWVARDGVEVQ